MSADYSRVMRKDAVSSSCPEVLSRQVRRLCQACHERRARFRYRGEVRADRHHTLCFECYRAERNRLRAMTIALRLQRVGLCRQYEARP